MSFLNSSQINILTGIFDRHFSTFSSGINNYVTVYKEPIKILNNVNSLNLPGYSEDSLNENDFTYSIQSQTFPSMIIYPANLKEKPFTELHFSLSENDLLIKVKNDAKDYIVNGKTENVDINGLKYNISSDFKIQNYFSSLYYYFKCTITQ